MNILYLADPGSIHDIRWINFFAERPEFNCYIIARMAHRQHSGAPSKPLSSRAKVVGFIEDPSTIRFYCNWFQVGKVKSLIKEFKIDLFHIIYAEPNALWTNWRWLFQVPIVVTTRGTDVLKTLTIFFRGDTYFGKLISWQYRRAFERADAVTCTSEAQMERLREFGVSSPIDIIRTGVDLSAIETSQSDVAERLGLKRPFILMPRKMAKLYNHEFTLDAISMLNESTRKRFVFAFLRADEKDCQYFISIADKAKSISATIRFIPVLNHNDLISLYKQASLVVMNPKSDGSPVTAMEAMALKKPVILPPLCYDPEIFGDAFFFKVWNPVALKEEIEKVVNMDSDERDQQIERCYQTIIHKCDSNKEMLRIEAIYNKLIRK